MYFAYNIRKDIVSVIDNLTIGAQKLVIVCILA